MNYSSDDSNATIIISRMQQRRGLKQDLPQPLRPAEIGYATDSRQVFIGAETLDDGESLLDNRTVRFENTINSKTISQSLANTHIIKFEMPHKRFPVGSSAFDGSATSISWSPTGTRFVGTASNVFPAAKSTTNVLTGLPFRAGDITVKVNDINLSGDTANTTPFGDFDYSFAAGTLSHSLTLDFAPENTDFVSVSYYDKQALLTEISEFYTDQSIPDFRKFSENLVYVNSDDGTAYLGLQDKHLDIITVGSSVLGANISSLGNLIIARSSGDPSGLVPSYSGTAVGDNGSPVNTFTITLDDPILELSNTGAVNHVYLTTTDAGISALLNGNLFEVSNVSGNVFQVTTTISNGNTGPVTVLPARRIDLSAVASVQDVVAAAEADNSWIKVRQIPGTTDRLYLYTNDQVEYRVFNDPGGTTASDLGFGTGLKTRETGTIKAIFEGWLDNRVVDNSQNIINRAFTNQPYVSVTNLETWELDVNLALNQIEFTTNDQAQNFVKTINEIYTGRTGTDTRALVNSKNNIELLTTETPLAFTVNSFTDPNTHQATAGTSTVDDLNISITDFDVFFIEYSFVANDGSNTFSRVGSISAIANSDADGGNGAVTINDVSSELLDGYSGNVEFSADIVSNRLVLTVNNNLQPASTGDMKYIVRRWLS